LIRESEVLCEYPLEAESSGGSKISAAVALFKLARVLSTILDELYAAKTGVLLGAVASLQDELDTWTSELPAHLRLHFEKDRPSTRTIHSRAPLLVGQALGDTTDVGSGLRISTCTR
jgi:hypothetical protein